MPANIFFNTSIPTTVIILKKNRDNKDVLFIDASNEFTKAKNQNVLEEKHIDRILETYKNREEVEKYAYVASFEEIVENDFNLNIPRYVDTFEEEEPISLAEVAKDLKETQQKIEEANKELAQMVQELTASTKEGQQELDQFMELLGMNESLGGEKSE